MIAQQFLILIFAIGVFAMLITAVYTIFDFLNVQPRQRLKFIKMGLISAWLILLASALLHSFFKSSASGSLNIVSEFNNFAQRNATHIFDKSPSHLPQLLLAIYVAVVVWMLLRLVISFLQAKKLFKDSQEINVNGYKVYKTKCISNPLSFGFLNPKIFISEDLLSKDPRSIELALTHEATHIANNDHPWKLFSLFTRAFLFFVPTMNYLHRKFELEMEIECDQNTISKTHSTAYEYGNLLLEFAQALNVPQPYSVYTNMTDSTLTKRIIVMKTKMARRPVLTMVFGLAVLAAGIVATVATSGATKLGERFYVEVAVLIAGKVVSKPSFELLRGEPASLSYGSSTAEIRMMLTATDADEKILPNGIHLVMDMAYQGQGQSVKANPQVIVKPGEPAIVQLNSGNGDSVEMQILAFRK